MVKKIHNYCRLLTCNEQVADFLDDVAHFDYSSDPSIISKIVSSEWQLIGYDETRPTSSFKENRAVKFKDDKIRWKLRQEVVNDLFTLNRLENDNDIKLSVGGALPRCAVKKEKMAIIVIGLPASGKSYFTNQLSDKHGAIILDSDYAKRKLPEYSDYGIGATLLHDESDQIVFGFNPQDSSNDFKSLFEMSSPSGCNFVIPKVGAHTKSIINLAKILKSRNYNNHLVLINLDRSLATNRAVKRFMDTGRYVPLSLIFDVYSNEPTLTYYRIKRINGGLFKSFSKISTEKKDSKIIQKTKYSPI